jgi:hypothetical protein
MVPTKTIEIIGQGQMKALAERREDGSAAFAVYGGDLNDLRALALRLNSAMTDANELRDWQNRLNLLVDNARSQRL